ncbi:MAG: type II toxin-antitoxin system VapC family toxin, partial [Wenzhouxiangella sp.]|nr:type II toxin-antitoxin system VapC family toxin [Wenzhouxiangella sp.]
MSRILVVDASAATDLLARFRPDPISELFWAADTRLAAPEILDVEVLHALRRLDRDGRIPTSRANLASELQALPIRRYRHDSLITRIWALRGHLTAYDAAYVVLATLLNADLVTRDERLARASGLGERV